MPDNTYKLTVTLTERQDAVLMFALDYLVANYDDFKEVMAEKRGFIVAGWNGDPAIEARIKEETKAPLRVTPMGEAVEAACAATGQKGREVVFAQAY